MKPQSPIRNDPHRLSTLSVDSDKGRRRSIAPPGGNSLKPPRRPSELSSGRRVSNASHSSGRGTDEASYRDLLAENGKLLSKIEDLERRNEELQSHMKSEFHNEREKNLQLEMNIDEFQVLYAKSKEEVSSLHQQLSSARAECQRNWSLFDETRHTLEAERCEAASLREQVRHLRDAIDAEQMQRGVQTMQRDSIVRRQGLGVGLSLDLASSDNQVDETDAPDSVGANALLFHSRTFADSDLAATSFTNQPSTINTEVSNIDSRADCDLKGDEKDMTSHPLDTIDPEELGQKQAGSDVRPRPSMDSCESSSVVDPLRTELASVFEAVADEHVRKELASAVCTTQRQNEELRCECEELKIQVSRSAESQQETTRKSEAVTELLRQNAELRHRCMKLRDQVSRAMDAEREVRRSDDILFEGERLRDTFEEILDSRRYVEADLVQTIEDLHQKCERLRQQASKSLERDRKSCNILEKGVRRESRMQGGADQLDEIRNSFMKLPSIKEEVEREDVEPLNGQWQHEREQLREQVATVVEIEKERRKSAVNLSHHLEEQCKQLQENAANAEQAEAKGTRRQNELQQKLNKMKTEMDAEVAFETSACAALETQLRASEKVECEYQKGLAAAETELHDCQAQESHLKRHLARMEEAEVEAHQKVSDGLHLSQRLFEEWQESSNLSQVQTNVFRTLEAELAACEHNTTIASESEHCARQRLEDQLYHEEDLLRREVNVSHSKDKVYRDLEAELLQFENQAEVSEQDARKNMEHVKKLVEEQCEENAGMQLKALEDKSKVTEQELRKAMEDRLTHAENKYSYFEHGSKAFESELCEEMKDKMRTIEGQSEVNASKALEAEHRLRDITTEFTEIGSKMQEEHMQIQEECERFKHEVNGAIAAELKEQASASEMKQGMRTLRSELEQRAAKTAHLESLKSECDHLRLEASGAATALRDANSAVEEELRKSQSGHRNFESKLEAERRSSVAQYRTNKELSDEYNQLKRDVLEACLVERQGRLALEEKLQEECDHNEELATEWLQAALQIEQEGDLCRTEEELATRSGEYESQNEILQEQVEDMQCQRKKFEAEHAELQDKFNSMQAKFKGSLEELSEEERKNAVVMNRSLEFECTQLRDLAAGALDAERKARLCAEHGVAQADMEAHREILACEKIQEQAAHALEAESKASNLAEQRLQKSQRLQRENDELRRTAASTGKRLSIQDGKRLERECEEHREKEELAENKLRKLRRSSGLQINKDLQRECQQLQEEQSEAQKYAELAHELEDANLEECLENAEAEQQKKALEHRIALLEEEFGVAAGSVQAGLNLHDRLRKDLERVMGSAEEDLKKHQNDRRDLERRHENAVGAAQAESKAHKQSQGEMQETISNLRRRESNIEESARKAIELEEAEAARKQQAVEEMQRKLLELRQQESNSRESAIMALEAQQAEVAAEEKAAQELRQVLAQLRRQEMTMKRQAESEEVEAAVKNLAVEEMEELLSDVQLRESKIQKQAQLAAEREQEAVVTSYEEIKAMANEFQRTEAETQQLNDILRQELASAVIKEQEANASADLILQQQRLSDEEKNNMEMLAREAIASAKEEMELRGQTALEYQELETFSEGIAKELWCHENTFVEECRSYEEQLSDSRDAEAQVQRLLANQHEQHQALQQQCMEMRSELLGAFAEEREVRDSAEVAMLEAIRQLRQEEVELEEQSMHAVEAAESLQAECDALRLEADHAEQELGIVMHGASDQTLSEGLLVECKNLHEQISRMGKKEHAAEEISERCHRELHQGSEQLREFQEQSMHAMEAAEILQAECDALRLEADHAEQELGIVMKGASDRTLTEGLLVECKNLHEQISHMGKKEHAYEKSAEEISERCHRELHQGGEQLREFQEQSMHAVEAAESLQAECDALRLEADHAEQEVVLLMKGASEQSLSEALLAECKQLHEQVSRMGKKESVAEEIAERRYKELHQGSEELRELQKSLDEMRKEGYELESEKRSLKVAMQRETEEELRQLLAEAQSHEEEMQKQAAIVEAQRREAEILKQRAIIAEREQEQAMHAVAAEKGLQAECVALRSEADHAEQELGILMKGASEQSLSESLLAECKQLHMQISHMGKKESVAEEIAERRCRELHQSSEELRELQESLDELRTEGDELENEKSKLKVAMQREVEEELRQLLAEAQSQEAEIQQQTASVEAQRRETEIQKQRAIVAGREQESEARWYGISETLHAECEALQAREASAIAETHAAKMKLQEMHGSLLASSLRSNEFDVEREAFKVRNSELQQEARHLQESLAQALSNGEKGAEAALIESWNENKALQEQVACSNAMVVAVGQELVECREMCNEKLHIASANAVHKHRAYGAKQLLASMNTARMAFVALGKASSGPGRELQSADEESRQQTLLDQCNRLQEHAERTTELEERLHEMLAAKRQKRLGTYAAELPT